MVESLKRPLLHGFSYQIATSFLPANFAPVNFSPSNNSEPASSEPLNSPDLCGCNSRDPPYCYRRKIINTTCCGMTVEKINDASCSDPEGDCATYTSRGVPCDFAPGDTCIQDVIHICLTGLPTPTPTPTPDSTPTPAPECDPNTEPNPTNCTCEYSIGPGPQPAIWRCGCTYTVAGGVFIGEPANYRQYPQNGGCPPNLINNGRDCC